MSYGSLENSPSTCFLFSLLVFQIGGTAWTRPASSPMHCLCWCNGSGSWDNSLWCQDWERSSAVSLPVSSWTYADVATSYMLFSYYNPWRECLQVAMSSMRTRLQEQPIKFCILIRLDIVYKCLSLIPGSYHSNSLCSLYDAARSQVTAYRDLQIAEIHAWTTAALWHTRFWKSSIKACWFGGGRSRFAWTCC